LRNFWKCNFSIPRFAPVAGLRPGSITFATPMIPSSGSTVAAVTADLGAAMLALVTAVAGNTTSAAWIMSPAAALFLATLRTAEDVFAFPGMSLGGLLAADGPR